MSRLRDSQLGDDKVSDIGNYIKQGKLWEAFEADEQVVLLIDEIDKADIEFPNDLLQELDRMEFFVYETGETIKASKRPIIIITSNNEKELPDAFLRRCFFHFINFPDRDTMRKIVDVHYPSIKKTLVQQAMEVFLRRARDSRPEEKAVDVGVDRLAETADGRRYSRRDSKEAGTEQGDSAAVRCAVEERAGRAYARASGVHASPRTLASLIQAVLESEPVPMLINFFHGLKDAGIPVSINGVADLIEALSQNLAFADIEEFYFLARTLPGQGRKIFRQF